jgi:hypothetical protein
MHAVLPKYLPAEAVEGSDVCPIFEARSESSDPASHFVGRLVRKSQGKQAKILACRVFEQRRDAAGKDLCFAGSWACEHQQRSLTPFYCFLLNV